MGCKLYRLNLRIVCSALICMLLSTNAFAVNQTPNSNGGSKNTVRVTGTVKDASGIPVVGASVIEKGTGNGTITNDKGAFTLTVKPKATLQVQFLGYEPKEVAIGNATSFNIKLETSSENIEEVVVVGYGVQKKATLTGAVSQIKSDEIVTTKNENVQNMLTGKVPGLRVVQNTSEPGQFNASMDIRGFGAPLVVIDGIPRNNMARIDPEDIESISVLKDASAAVYGVRAANGVVLITTKKGTKSAATISYSGNMTWQKLSNFPDLVGAADWMRLYNERKKHNVDNSIDNPTYTDADIEAYLNGTKKETNWREEVLRNSAPQTQHNLSISGGTDAISYYASIGYQYQGSFVKTDAINYDKYTLRSNISAKVSKNIKFDLNIAGFIDERRSTPYGSQDIIRSMWIHRPMDPVHYKDDPEKYYRVDWNGGIFNPVAMMDKDLTGSNSYKSKWFQSSAAITYNIPYVKGLSVKGLYSYDFTLNDNKEFAKAYKLYNDNNPNGTDVNKPTTGSYRNSRYYYGKNASLWQAQVAYNRSFERHNIAALALFENSHNDGDNFYGTRYANLMVDQVFAGNTDKQEFNQSSSSSALYDNANQALVGRLNYDFGGKYLAEFAFRYEGSSKFPAYSRWAFFPSVLAGWRISEEKFWKESPLKFIDNFKIRGSYGKTGDDSALNYQFLTGYSYPASGTNNKKIPGGYIFGDQFIISSSDKGLANMAITWYTSKTLNLGIDADAWNGLLGITAEYYRRHRDGLLTTRSGSLPGIVGASLPQENLNSDLTQGFELELSHKNRIGEFSYQVKGNLSYTRTKTLYAERAKEGNSYTNWRRNTNDRYNNIWWGYEGNGRLENWNDIYYNPVYYGGTGRGTVPGDYQYVDWNGDGMINDLDVHPLATNGQVPLLYYGLTLSAQWRGFDLSMLWQGAGKKYVIARQFLYQPLWSDTNATTDFLDRWHPEDTHADPYNPATKWIPGEHSYTGSLPDANSDFNIQNAAYLRLKNIELGYTLPRKWLKAVNLQSVRVYFSAYNLLTITKLKYMDPEFYVTNDTGKEGLGDLGYNYPINKTFTIGLNVKF